MLFFVCFFLCFFGLVFVLFGLVFGGDWVLVGVLGLLPGFRFSGAWFFDVFFFGFCFGSVSGFSPSHAINYKKYFLL